MSVLCRSDVISLCYIASQRLQELLEAFFKVSYDFASSGSNITSCIEIDRPIYRDQTCFFYALISAGPQGWC